jgi:2'-5' RNA ligase
MKRLFAAIKIHPSARFISVLNAISASLSHERIKWVEPENMHLTLKFFGETAENKIPAICKAMQNSASKSKPFTLNIANTGIFGSRYDPKVIWFGINNNEVLQNLAENIFAELEAVDYARDRQNFVPHLTIGRIKEVNDKSLFQQIISKYNTIDIQQEHVGEIVLYESILDRKGPTYVKIFSAQL